MSQRFSLGVSLPAGPVANSVPPRSSAGRRWQEALKNHDSWMEDVSNTLQQMQEKEENLTEDGQGVARGVVGHGDGDDGGG